MNDTKIGSSYKVFSPDRGSVVVSKYIYSEYIIDGKWEIGWILDYCNWYIPSPGYYYWKL